MVWEVGQVYEVHASSCEPKACLKLRVTQSQLDLR